LLRHHYPGDEMTEREKFEAWHKGYVRSSSIIAMYPDDWAWLGWQAARASRGCLDDDCPELCSLKDSYGQLLAENVAQRAEIAQLREDAERWHMLFLRALNEANGLTNYVEDRPELRSAEKRISAIERDARTTIDAQRKTKEQA
jgi:hypothetical protein